MDPWTNLTPAEFVLSPGVQGPDPQNPLFAGILEAKRLLPDATSSVRSPDSKPGTKEALYSAICDGDLVATEAAIASSPELLDSCFPANDNGYTSLIFAVAFAQEAIVESLLRIHEADPDLPDTTQTKYTPLMWAVVAKNVSIVSLLLEFHATPNLSPSNNGVNASSLASSSSPEIFEYFKSHNLFANELDDAELYPLPTFGDSHADPIDDVAFKIRMSTLGTSHDLDASDDENGIDEEAQLAQDTQLTQIPEFDYNKPLPNQFIKFSDSDIPSLLDYIFGLRTSSSAQQHNTKTPAAVLFQLVHYSHNKVDSSDLTEFLFECFITRLRSVTNTKSGVFNMALTTGESNDKKSANGTGDIVLLSYWLSVIQFLHFYFTRADLYTRYPKFLHEMINLTQSLIATLSFSINSRLNLLAEECILNFTSLVDVSSVLYAKDWNLFKTQKKHPNSYDDILNMLYPPSLNELMKPSPLKYVQVLGALYYVLDIHGVDLLLRAQTFSQVFYYINATIFNRLIANSRYCSRVKAIQIRLNISALEDWLRSHNFNAYKPDRIGGLETLLEQSNGLSGVNQSLLENKIERDDPHYLSFYYESLYHISKTQLLPTIELLQWLQVLTGLGDEEALINTVNEFESLNYHQFVKVSSKLYRYEVDEKKMPKALIQILKRLMAEQGEAQISRSKLHYMTQSTFLSKEVYIYLNPNHIFGVALPNASELIANYGAGIGGVKILRARKYQPTLPISIMDDIDMLLTQNRNDNVNDTFDYEGEEYEKETEGLTSPDMPVVRDEPRDQNTSFKGDELFKQMQPPSSLAHKEWGTDDIENNPW
ncbi:hypothetical protein OXX59_001308 [Metschnikowia pulcherrima]